jgi:hypothetical protein
VLWEPNNGVTQNRGVVAWPLYKVVDPDGNYLVVTYNQAAGTFYPLRVEYNLPLVGAQGRAMSVHFQYENRPDRTPMPSYHARRLKNIRVYGQSIPPSTGALIRRYELGYTTSAASGRSLLTSFQEFGSDGNDASAVGLEAQTFSYTPGIDLLRVSESSLGDLVPNCKPGPDVSDCLWHSFVGDLNADGKADLVRTYYGSYGGKVLYRCGGENWLSTPPVEHTNYSGVQPTYLTAMGDVNGDGRQDIVAISPHAGTLTTYIAYGEHANNTCALGDWILQPSQTVHNVTMSPSPAEWRILAADFDGDGMSDVVLFDQANTVLYWKLYRDGHLSAIRAGRYRSGEWTSCNAGYYPPEIVGFNGIDVTDYNGDGKADIVASWSRRDGDVSGAGHPGMISMLTALGTSSGLGPPSEACHTPATFYPSPAVRYRYTAMRHGDINGDGRGDSILTYQGKAIRVNPPSICDRTVCSGLIHGRDIRFRLGTTLAAGSGLQVYATDPSTYPYASAHERPAHLNQWQFATADINGDGIDDYIQSYAGAHGDKLYYALGNPTGLAALQAAVDSSTAMPDNATADYHRSMMVTGDFNGDRLMDVARIHFWWDPPSQGCDIPSRCPNTPHGSLQVHWGGAMGLSTAPLSLTIDPVMGGDSHAIDVRVADINGDGRDDLLFVNNNADPPIPGGPGPSRQGSLA